MNASTMGACILVLFCFEGRGKGGAWCEWIVAFLGVLWGMGMGWLFCLGWTRVLVKVFFSIGREVLEKMETDIIMF